MLLWKRAWHIGTAALAARSRVALVGNPAITRARHVFGPLDMTRFPLAGSIANHDAFYPHAGVLTRAEAGLESGKPGAP